MHKIISENHPFFLGFFVWLIVGAILQIFFTQNELIFWVNQHNNSWLDLLFKYGTNLGDGVFGAIFVIILLVFRQKKSAFSAALSLIFISGIFIYYLKEYLRTPRPITVFTNNLKEIHLVEGVKIAEWFSFPSGHTAVAFTIFMVFSLIVKNKNWGILFLFLAIFVGYSRMYLFQHFAIDVYAGSIFGVVFTLIIFYFFEKRVQKI